MFYLRSRKRKSKKVSSKVKDPKNPDRWLTGPEMKVYRQELFDAQGGLCHWCNGCMTIPPVGSMRNTGDVATFEHLKDRFSVGGRQSDAETIVLACSDCNGKRNKEREALVMAAIKEHLTCHKEMRGMPMKDLVQKLVELGVYPISHLP